MGSGREYCERHTTREDPGEWPPDGLGYQVAFSSNDSFRVSEIWYSKAQFEAFGQRLMPSGVELTGPPEMIEIHNIVKR